MVVQTWYNLSETAKLSNTSMIIVYKERTHKIQQLRLHGCNRDSKQKIQWFFKSKVAEHFEVSFYELSLYRKNRLDRCYVKRTNNFVKCRMGIVYEVSFSNGPLYVEQTGGCTDQIIIEHNYTFVDQWNTVTICCTVVIASVLQDSQVV